MTKIQIFIATYNRPLLIIKAINSALCQDFDSYEVIVSDNSTNDETEILIKTINNKHLTYIRRNPSLPFVDHLNIILQDVSAEYFMIFHDDDFMHENIIKTLYNKLIINNNIVAIGTNAKFIVNGNLQKKNYNPKLKSDYIITNRNELIERYLLYNIVPFPSYLYKRVIAKKLQFNSELGGKYCDASFIINLLTIGPICFSAAPLMDYHIHSNQVSSENDFVQKLKLINFFIRTSNFTKNHPLIIRLRIQNIFVEVKELIKKNKFSLYSKRNQRIIKTILKGSPFEYFPRIVYSLLLKTLK